MPKALVHARDPNFHLFYGGPFSQWKACTFRIEGVYYNCAEQWMMAQKARLFRDPIALKAIMETDDPSTQKMVGRAIRHYSDEVWHAVAKDVVFRGNVAKFSQDPRLATALLATGQKVLVEASPTDRIWGIGLAEDDPRAYDPGQWRGSNWLGLILQDVRDVLLSFPPTGRMN